MRKPLNEMTDKQLEKELRSARFQWGKSGSIASLDRFEKAEAEVARRFELSWTSA